MHTIFIRFPNKKERDHMWTFLQSFDWDTLTATEEGEHDAWKTGELLGLSPRAGSTIIGLRSNDPPQWAWAVAAWMANRSTYRIHQWGVIHHDDEEIPVILSAQHHGNDVLVLDNDRKLLAWRDRELPRGPDHVQQKDFIDTLNSVWDDMQAAKKTKKK